MPENGTVKMYVICHLGNDSQTAGEALRGLGQRRDPSRDPEMGIKNIIGGLRAWTRQVDPGFPEY
jgi:adenylyltransferase and sulfurtransferase